MKKEGVWVIFITTQNFQVSKRENRKPKCLKLVNIIASDPNEFRPLVIDTFKGYFEKINSSEYNAPIYAKPFS